MLEPTERDTCGWRSDRILECVVSDKPPVVWRRELIKLGDMVIGRKTAPLVSLCIRLISRGIKATIKGKDIGESLKKDLEDIAKMRGYSFEFFNDAIAQ